MASIEIFKNESFGEVRVAGTSERPLFCLADLCSVLELRPNDVRQRLDDGVVSTHPITDSLGREQQANFVNEDGMYDVILDSRKPQARAFRKWITSEILPSIRKTGGYSVKTEISKLTISDKMKAATWAAKFLNLDEHSKLIMAKAILDPMGLPTKDYSEDESLLPITTLIKKKGVVMSGKAANKKLLELGLLEQIQRYSRSRGKYVPQWVITDKGKKFGKMHQHKDASFPSPAWFVDKSDDLINLLTNTTTGGLTYGE